MAPFDTLFGDNSPAARRRERQRQYEQGRVAWLLKTTGLQRYQQTVRERDPLEQNALSFRGLNEAFEWPVWFVTHDALNRRNATPWSKIFQQFPRQPFVKAFDEEYSALLDDIGTDEIERKPVGLVFPRPGFPQSLLLYRGELEELNERGTVLRFAQPDEPPYGLVSLRDAVLIWIATGRVPEEARD